MSKKRYVVDGRKSCRRYGWAVYTSWWRFKLDLYSESLSSYYSWQGLPKNAKYNSKKHLYTVNIDEAYVPPNGIQAALRAGFDAAHNKKIASPIRALLPKNIAEIVAVLGRGKK